MVRVSVSVRVSVFRVRVRHFITDHIMVTIRHQG
jgi:hypothetical protein